MAMRILTGRDLLRQDRLRAPKMVLGLDLGQRRDWTALAIVERRMEPRPLPEDPATTRLTSTYAVPYLDRTQEKSYEAIAADMVALKREPRLADATLVIDETGVGVAVGDMLDARTLRPERVTITGGDTATSSGSSHRVPKRDLATVVAVMLESQRLKVAEGLPLTETLVKELENFKVKITATGHDRYGAGDDWRVGNHDDLVLAVALAIWWGEQPSREMWRA